MKFGNIHGGSFKYDFDDMRCAIRNWNHPDNHSCDLGFRMTCLNLKTSNNRRKTVKTCKLDIATLEKGDYIVSTYSNTKFRLVHKSTSCNPIWQVEDEDGNRISVDVLDGSYVQLCDEKEEICDMSNMFKRLGLRPILGKPTIPDDRIKDFMDKKQNAKNTSIGESKYHEKSIQPYDIWEIYPQNPWRNDIVKRTIRTKDGQRRLDTKKIGHISNVLIQNPHLDWFLNLDGKTLKELYEDNVEHSKKIMVELKFK